MWNHVHGCCLEGNRDRAAFRKPEGLPRLEGDMRGKKKSAVELHLEKMAHGNKPGDGAGEAVADAGAVMSAGQGKDHIFRPYAQKNRLPGSSVAHAFNELICNATLTVP